MNQLKMSDKFAKPIIYKGPSMNPTLKNLDLLIIVPYGEKKIRQGDVITFMPPDRDISITHRVVSINEKGVITLGDNNDFLDDYLLQPEDIWGCVEYAERKNKRIKIYGGTSGRVYAKTIRAIRRLKFMVPKMFMPFRPVYGFFHRSGLLAKFVPDKMKPRTIYYEKQDGDELHLLMGKWLVGRLDRNRTNWSIKIPFKLFIDEKELMEFREKFMKIHD
jgi:signal peptidase I